MTIFERRQFLASGAAAAATLSTRTPASAQRQSVIVIGAGIVGASIAYHLARRGAQVTVLEKERPGAGATEDSFAWITCYDKRPRSYQTLTLAGVMGWRRLSLDLRPSLRVQWGGSVHWVADDADAAQLKVRVAERERFGYPMRLIDRAELEALMPGVQTGPVSAAAFAELEGTLDPLEATSVLLAEAQKLGAKVIYPCVVTALEGRAGAIDGLITNRGRMAADRYVLAAGVGTMQLAREVDIAVPMVEAAGVLAHSKPMPPIVKRVIILPGGGGVSIKQNPDGRVVVGAHFGQTGQLEPTAALGAEMLAEAARRVPLLKHARLDFMTRGKAPKPKDGLPVAGIGAGHPNVFVAAMDTGVTLAPVIGELAGIELIDGVATDLLDPYRSSRFAAA